MLPAAALSPACAVYAGTGSPIGATGAAAAALAAGLGAASAKSGPEKMSPAKMSTVVGRAGGDWLVTVSRLLAANNPSESDDTAVGGKKSEWVWVSKPLMGRSLQGKDWHEADREECLDAAWMAAQAKTNAHEEAAGDNEEAIQLAAAAWSQHFKARGERPPLGIEGPWLKIPIKVLLALIIPRQLRAKAQQAKKIQQHAQVRVGVEIKCLSTVSVCWSSTCRPTAEPRGCTFVSIISQKWLSRELSQTQHPWTSNNICGFCWSQQLNFPCGILRGDVLGSV